MGESPMGGWDIRFHVDMRPSWAFGPPHKGERLAEKLGIASLKKLLVAQVFGYLASIFLFHR
jgi:hypothetical protein